MIHELVITMLPNTSASYQLTLTATLRVDEHADSVEYYVIENSLVTCLPRTCLLRTRRNSLTFLTLYHVSQLKHIV